MPLLVENGSRQDLDVVRWTGALCRNGRKPENRMNKREVVNGSWAKRGRRMSSIMLHHEEEEVTCAISDDKVRTRGKQEGRQLGSFLSKWCVNHPRNWLTLV